MVLTRIEGIESADVSYEAGRAVITYDPARTTPDRFIPELEELTGYQAEVIADAAPRPGADDEHGDDAHHTHESDSTHAH